MHVTIIPMHIHRRAERGGRTHTAPGDGACFGRQLRGNPDQKQAAAAAAKKTRTQMYYYYLRAKQEQDTTKKSRKKVVMSACW